MEEAQQNDPYAYDLRDFEEHYYRNEAEFLDVKSIFKTYLGTELIEQYEGNHPFENEPEMMQRVARTMDRFEGEKKALITQVLGYIDVMKYRRTFLSLTKRSRDVILDVLNNPFEERRFEAVLTELLPVIPGGVMKAGTLFNLDSWKNDPSKQHIYDSFLGFLTDLVTYSYDHVRTKYQQELRAFYDSGITDLDLMLEVNRQSQKKFEKWYNRIGFRARGRNFKDIEREIIKRKRQLERKLGRAEEAIDVETERQARGPEFNFNEIEEAQRERDEKERMASYIYEEIMRELDSGQGYKTDVLTREMRRSIASKMMEKLHIPTNIDVEAILENAYVQGGIKGVTTAVKIVVLSIGAGTVLNQVFNNFAWFSTFVCVFTLNKMIGKGVTSFLRTTGTVKPYKKVVDKKTKEPKKETYADYVEKTQKSLLKETDLQKSFRSQQKDYANVRKTFIKDLEEAKGRRNALNRELFKREGKILKLKTLIEHFNPNSFDTKKGKKQAEENRERRHQELNHLLFDKYADTPQKRKELEEVELQIKEMKEKIKEIDKSVDELNQQIVEYSPKDRMLNEQEWEKRELGKVITPSDETLTGYAKKVVGDTLYHGLLPVSSSLLGLGILIASGLFSAQLTAMVVSEPTAVINETSLSWLYQVMFKESFDFKANRIKEGKKQEDRIKLDKKLKRKRERDRARWQQTKDKDLLRVDRAIEAAYAKWDKRKALAKVGRTANIKEALALQRDLQSIAYDVAEYRKKRETIEARIYQEKTVDELMPDYAERLESLGESLEFKLMSGAVKMAKYTSLILTIHSIYKIMDDETGKYGNTLISGIIPRAFKRVYGDSAPARLSPQQLYLLEQGAPIEPSTEMAISGAITEPIVSYSAKQNKFGELRDLLESEISANPKISQNIISEQTIKLLPLKSQYPETTTRLFTSYSENNNRVQQGIKEVADHWIKNYDFGTRAFNQTTNYDTVRKDLHLESRYGWVKGINLPFSKGTSVSSGTKQVDFLGGASSVVRMIEVGGRMVAESIVNSIPDSSIPQSLVDTARFGASVVENLSAVSEGKLSKINSDLKYYPSDLEIIKNNYPDIKSESMFDAFDRVRNEKVFQDVSRRATDFITGSSVLVEFESDELRRKTLDDWSKLYLPQYLPYYFRSATETCSQVVRVFLDIVSSIELSKIRWDLSENQMLDKIDYAFRLDPSAFQSETEQKRIESNFLVSYAMDLVGVNTDAFKDLPEDLKRDIEKNLKSGEGGVKSLTEDMLIGLIQVLKYVCVNTTALGLTIMRARKDTVMEHLPSTKRIMSEVMDAQFIGDMSQAVAYGMGFSYYFEGMKKAEGFDKLSALWTGGSEFLQKEILQNPIATLAFAKIFYDSGGPGTSLRTIYTMYTAAVRMLGVMDPLGARKIFF